ncbi:helix-turn-helix domain-containing protein [Methylobacterium indicum]|uniref:DNA-binding protein n=1 Tax=Methylobacterium indicum TaxID=1775910 RepID=A0A8H8WZA4_9HYPH|nr:hypothetical protein [Methylobacterium indicum]BCM87430.1 hypothetical protein mvi_58910 [Methylobacterium indicum]
MLEAKRALEAMLQDGRAAIQLPMLDDPTILGDELAASGVIATSDLRPPVDVCGLRSPFGLSLDDFALCYGLEREAVADWEEGRAIPDMTARSYLRVIERLPGEARRALAQAG